MSKSTQGGSCEHGGCSEAGHGHSAHDEEKMEKAAIAARMGRIGRKIIVLSGKGGVGKSTVAVNLAMALSMAGKKVGLMDVDIHGPNVPKMLHIEDPHMVSTGEGLMPVKVDENLSVMSIALLMQQKDDAVIWRGPMKYGLIKEFLSNVEWGDLDFLIVDCPPGTGDEPLSVVQLIGNADGAIIVTTPQQVAVLDVRRSIRFSQKLDLPVIGVVENMSGLVCPHCGGSVDLFGSGGGKALADEFSVPYLGSIPLDPRIVTSGDDGIPVVRSDPHGETSKAFGRIVRVLLASELGSARKEEAPADGKMRIAVPVADGVLCMHFGHCENFALYEVDTDKKTVVGKQLLVPPAHEPGVLPAWLHKQGANLIIAGGMGSRAQSLFTKHGVQVLTGATSGDPDAVIKSYLEDSLVTGDNVCDH